MTFNAVAPVICAGAFLAAVACAPTATQTAALAPDGRDCFNSNFMSGYTNVDQDTIRVSASPSRSYDLDLEGPNCRDIQWANSVAVVTKPSSYICTGNRAGLGEVKFRDGASNAVTTCWITEVRRYVKPDPAAAPAPAQ